MPAAWESRLEPLGSTFFDIEEDSSRALPTLLISTRASEMKRHHSFAGFLPFELGKAVNYENMEARQNDRKPDRPKTDGPPPEQSCAPTSQTSTAERNYTAASQTSTAERSCTVTSQTSSDDSTRASRIPEERTTQTATVMIRNLPRTMTQRELITFLSQHFHDRFDFCYAPCDFQTASGKGYAFVNFRSAPDASEFQLYACGLAKIGNHAVQAVGGLSIAPAVVQGLEANLKQLKSVKMSRIKNAALLPFIKRS